MKNLSKYIVYVLIGIAGLAIGFSATKLFTKKCETVYVPGEVITQVRDTCIDMNLLCTITSKDSMSIYTIIRKGLKSNSKPVVAQIEEVNYPKAEDIVKPLMERKYTKHFNNGNTQVWDTIVVVGEIKDWNRSHKINEVIEVHEKHTNTTAIIEQGKDDSNKEIIKYLPVETNSNKGAFLGLSGGLLYDGEVSYQAGLNISGERLGVTFYTTPTDWQRVGLQLNTKLIRLKK